MEPERARAARQTERPADHPAECPAGLPVGCAGPPDPDPLDEVISLAEAARLSGLAAHTLTLQAERGKLRARKLGHTWITTRYWLGEYVRLHRRRKAARAGEPPEP